MNNSNLSLADFAKELIKHDDFLVTAHTSPDMDAFASAFGLAEVLSRLGKSVRVFFEERLPTSAERLFAKMISAHLYTELPQGYENCVGVVTDTANLERVSNGYEIVLDKIDTVFNLDHHVSNPNWGTFNCVDASSSSAALLVLDVAQELGVDVDRTLAELLIAGIYSDTGSLRFSNTDRRTIDAVGQLIDSGADVSSIANVLFFEEPLSLLQLRADMVQTIRTDCNGKFAMVFLSKSMIEERGILDDDLGPIVDVCRGIEGVIVAVAAKQKDDGWKLSFRSKRSDIDVNKMAAKFGGGGHPMAAGARVSTCTREELYEQVRQEVAKVNL